MMVAWPQNRFLKKSAILFDGIIIARVMIILNALLFLFLHSYLSIVSRAYPLDVINLEKSKIAIFKKEVEDSRKKLLKLIRSPENKLLFQQLQKSRDSYFDVNHNIVGTTEFPRYNQYQRQPYVANGYIGSRISNLGQGFSYDQHAEDNDDLKNLLNGWPLFNRRYAGAFISGFYNIQAHVNKTNYPELYQNGYESIISSVPQWTSLTLSTMKDGVEYFLDPSMKDKFGNITNYNQKLSLENGIVTTEFTWLDSLQVRFTVLAHRKALNLGVVNVEISNLGSKLITVKVEDILDFETSQRCQLVETNYDDSGIYILFQPNNLPYINAAIYSRIVDTKVLKGKTEGTASQYSILSIEPHSYVSLTKYVGVTSSDLKADYLKGMEETLAYSRNITVIQSTLDSVIEDHISGWKSTIGSINITFPEDMLMTLTSRASLYHLAANSRSNAKGVTAALPVGGLSSDSYGGMVFWDADLWMFNGILPFLPTNAKSIVNYRLNMFDQAQKNVPKGYEGAAYPWTSGRFGNCTSTGPCLDYEYHINFAVVQAAWNLYLSGAEDDNYLKESVLPLMNNASTFLADHLVKFNDSVGKYETHNLTDPDEFANNIDNGAYTNAAISSLMRWTSEVSDHLQSHCNTTAFKLIADNMYLPSSENVDNITLEYSGMKASVGVKQADVIMLTYPLNNELIDYAQAFKNMEFYSQKQVSYGPAMTFPIFSIVSSKVAPKGCSSQSYIRKAVSPYLRAPFAQFSEQNNDNFATNGGQNPAFPFMTAHGGFLQAVVQGLAGLKYGYQMEKGKIVRYLEVDPVSVETFGNQLEISGIKYFNHSLSFSFDHTDFKIRMDNGSGATISDVLNIIVNERNSKSGKYTLGPGNDISIPLFKPERSSEDSLIECEDSVFISLSEGMDGDQSSSMNDGDNFTHWQAKHSYEPAKVLIDLKKSVNISGGSITWSDKPPRSWSLSKVRTNVTFNSSFSVLSQVDFNETVSHYFLENGDSFVWQEEEVFEKLIDNEVKISSPLLIDNDLEVTLPRAFNVTNFNLQTSTEGRFFLIKFFGTHDVWTELDSGGKISEVEFR